MTIDGIILHQIKRELSSYFPCKLMKIQQISDFELIFHIRTNSQTHQLLISLHSTYNRIHLTKEKYQTLEHPNNFVMLLRKQIDGATFISIDQIGLDRIFKISIDVRNDLGDIHRKYLYVELMGKYANLILVNKENKIIDALKRIPPFEENRRIIFAGATFILPEQHAGKKDPFATNLYNLEESFVKQFHGFSPLLSKEVQYRIHKGQKFADIIQEIGQSSSIFITYEAQKTYFHCIPLLHLEKEYIQYPTMTAFDTIYYSIEELVRAKQSNTDLYRIVKQELHKVEKKLPKLKHSYEESLDFEKYQVYADLLYAHPHTEKQALVELPNFENTKMINIPLNMKLDIKQNAKKFYQKYHKLKRGLIILQEQIARCEQDIVFWDNLNTQLSQASALDAEEIREELIKLGYIKTTHHKKKKKKNDIPHFTIYQIDHVPIYVGKNNIQNDYITFHIAKKTDIWMHAQGYHGAHVLIQESNPSENVLRAAAMLAAYFSKGRDSSSVPVDYCAAKEIKKIPGANMGLVAIHAHKTIYIDPDPIQIEKWKQNIQQTNEHKK